MLTPLEIKLFEACRDARCVLSTVQYAPKDITPAMMSDLMNTLREAIIAAERTRDDSREEHDHIQNG